eukprot:NODE_3602_length_765_cov_216.269014.p5 GENE.NODE_3602_length_765_cov_216.269014~~NODE_3602_length_765_cov_216.269014.p5  ORF type:complete len:78 (-),score=8.86 NODE_3602_length_765_cov_216.269014:119-352(-)
MSEVSSLCTGSPCSWRSCIFRDRDLPPNLRRQAGEDGRALSVWPCVAADRGGQLLGCWGGREEPGMSCGAVADRPRL